MTTAEPSLGGRTPVLLVGTGPTAVAHHHALRAAGAEVVVVGRSPEGCARFAGETGTAALPGGLDTVTSVARDVGAAVVAVPVPSLAATTTAVLGTGVRRVLVEKPGGLDRHEVREVARRAGVAGADVRVAYNRRYLASVLRAAEVVEADGGPGLVAFDFTEWTARVLAAGHPPDVLAEWFVANSSHVVDLAFSFAGEPVEMTCLSQGSLAWHPAAARFAGAGVGARGALLAYGSDWGSAGRWGVEVTTPERRLVLRPLERLSEQRTGSMDVVPVEVDDAEDRQAKPGFLAQARDFLRSGGARLPTAAAQAERLEGAFRVMVRGGRLG